MKKSLSWVSVIVAELLLFGGLAISNPVAASNVTNAIYTATIRVSNANTTTAKTNVSTLLALNTANWTAAGYISTLSGVAVQSASAADVAFMPGTSNWLLHVASIAASPNTLTYKLYTNGASGGKLAYFPTSAGAAMTDNALEPGNSFSIQLQGWLNTAAAATKRIFYKDAALDLTVSNTTAGTLTATVHEQTQAPLTTTLYPNGDFSLGIPNTTDGGGVHYTQVDDPAGAHDGNTTMVSGTGPALMRDLYDAEDFTPSGGTGYSVTSVTVYVTFNGPASPNWAKAAPVLDIGGSIYGGGEGDTAYDTYTTVSATYYGAWSDAQVDAMRIGVDVRGIDVGFIVRCTQVYAVVTETYAAATRTVSLTGITSGDHTVTTTFAAGTLTLTVDAATNSTAGATFTVMNNANAWTYLLNDCFSYITYYKMWTGGVLQQHIVWSAIGTLDDIQNNYTWTTVNFRTTTSDAQVTTAFVDFDAGHTAQAPTTAVGTAVPLISPTTIPGTFQTNVTVTAPLAAVVADMAAASSTPAQWPFFLITGFLILMLSLSMSGLLKKYGSTTLWVKLMIIGIGMAISMAVGLYDWWMLVVFGILAIAAVLGDAEARRA